jgi:xanthosine phosphorylase
MTIKYTSAAASADIIALYKPDFKSKIAIILGSGLGEFADHVKDATIIPYYKLPGFHHCTAEGHAGNMLLGYVNSTPVVCLQGRPHIYEGIYSDVMKTLIRTLKLIGCEMLLLTNAAGSLRDEVPAGSLMLITDHINLQFTNPLVGPNDDEFGPRFFSMENAYNQDLRYRLQDIAKRLNIDLAKGVYIGVSGPSFETPAEIRAFRVMGADAVGMSTVPEVLMARHCNLKVAGISVITNLAAGMNPEEELSHEKTLRYAKLAAADLTNLMLTFCQEYESGA